MPKGPILDRTLVIEKRKNGTFRLLDWNLANTDVGAVVEPRQLNILPSHEQVTQVSVPDITFNRIQFMSEDEFYKLNGSGGRQVPVDF